MHIILQIPRLILRRFTNSDEDAALLIKLNSDPEVLKYLHEPVLQNLQQAKEIISNIILPQYEKGLGCWTVQTKNKNEFIGWCWLKHRPEAYEIDLGYRFIKTVWGKGYATEASLHTLTYGFKQLHLKTIVGRAHIENTGSLNVLKK